MSLLSDIPCISSCSPQSRCVQGVCVGIGYLSFTMVWSRPGDGDLVVTTPNGKTIYYDNEGPTEDTDFGQLDVDDRNKTGPENIFWPSSVPPTGVYYVCFEPYDFDIDASPENPCTVTITVHRLTDPILVVTRTYTSWEREYFNCTSTSNNRFATVTYP